MSGSFWVGSWRSISLFFHRRAGQSTNILSHVNSCNLRSRGVECTIRDRCYDIDLTHFRFQNFPRRQCFGTSRSSDATITQETSGQSFTDPKKKFAGSRRNTRPRFKHVKLNLKCLHCLPKPTRNTIPFNPPNSSFRTVDSVPSHHDTRRQTSPNPPLYHNPPPGRQSHLLHRTLREQHHDALARQHGLRARLHNADLPRRYVLGQGRWPVFKIPRQPPRSRPLFRYGAAARRFPAGYDVRHAQDRELGLWDCAGGCG